MPRARALFTQVDVKRAVAGVIAAGMKPARVEIEGGKIVVIADGTAAPTPINDLDAELREFETRRGLN
jgi:hypothetical protein